jgi:hypothetical protein
MSMETHAKPGEKETKLPQVVPLTINDVYEKIRGIIGEVEMDPHKLLKEMGYDKLIIRALKPARWVLRRFTFWMSLNLRIS